MNGLRDNELSSIYREGSWPEPRQQLDDAILEASRRAARARRSASLVWRFGPPFALAATVVLTFALLLRAYEEQPQTVPFPVPGKRPAPHVVQPAPRPAEEPKPEAAAKPASVPRSAPAPAAAASALALKKEAPGAAPADQARRGFQQLQENRSARESAPPREREPEARPEPAPPRESASPAAVPAPGAAVASGVAAERTPQAWLEDIRKLKAQGKNDDVQRELAEFKKRYPDYPLPDDLK